MSELSYMTLRRCCVVEKTAKGPLALRAAWAATVAYYRSGLREWTKQLG